MYPTLSSSSASKRILIAEVSAHHESVSQQLRERGYLVKVVDTGAAVLDAMAEELFDLVMMDVAAPAIKACAITSEIRRREGSDWHVPVLGWTGHPSDSDQTRCLAAGMNDYLMKPLEPLVLEYALSHWLDICPSPFAASGDHNTANSACGWDRGGRPVLDNAVLANLERLEAVYRTPLTAELIGLFLRHAPYHVTALQVALNRRDAEGAGHAAHLLKSGCGQLGATPLAELCEAIEEHAGSGAFQYCHSLLPRLNNEFQCVCTALRKRLETKLVL